MISVRLLLLSATLAAWGQDTAAFHLPGPPPVAQDAALPDPSPVPDDRALSPLPLQWPEWLEVPDSRLISQRATPRGRIGTWSVETCPGEIIGKPSAGCLIKVFQTPHKLNEVCEYFAALLEQHGFTTHSAPAQSSASLQLGKFIGEIFGSLTTREYPVPHQERYYRQVSVLLRHSKSLHTQVEITFLVNNPPPTEEAHDRQPAVERLFQPR